MAAYIPVGMSVNCWNQNRLAGASFCIWVIYRYISTGKRSYTIVGFQTAAVSGVLPAGMGCWANR